MPGAKTTKELVVQQAVHRLSGLLFNHHLQEDEVDAAIFILTPHPQTGVFYFLNDGVFKGIVQIHTAGNFCRKARFLLIGNKVGQEREIVADIRLGIEADRMRGILCTAVEAAFVAVLVDRFQVEINRRCQAGLMIEQFLNKQILLVGVFQFGDEIGNLIVQSELSS